MTGIPYRGQILPPTRWGSVHDADHLDMYIFYRVSAPFTSEWYKHRGKLNVAYSDYKNQKCVFK